MQVFQHCCACITLSWNSCFLTKRFDWLLDSSRLDNGTAGLCVPARQILCILLDTQFAEMLLLQTINTLE